MAEQKKKTGSGTGRSKASSGSTRSTYKKKTASGKKSSSKRAAAAGKKKKTGGVNRELILVASITVCGLLFLSLFGLIGSFGAALASFQFGICGSLAWLFPFLLFIAVAFLLSNYEEYPASSVGRVLLALGLLTVACGLCELLGGHGKEASVKLGNAYLFGRNGFRGGLFGGIWYRLLAGVLGNVGTFIVLFALLLAGAAVLSGKAFLSMLGEKSREALEAFRSENRRLKEEKADRALEEELKYEEQRRARADRLEAEKAEREKAAEERRRRMADLEALRLDNTRREEATAAGKAEDRLKAEIIGTTENTAAVTPAAPAPTGLPADKKERQEIIRRKRAEMLREEKEREKLLQDEKEKAAIEIAEARAKALESGLDEEAAAAAAEEAAERRTQRRDTAGRSLIDWENLNVASLPDELVGTPIDTIVRRMEEEKAAGARENLRLEDTDLLGKAGFSQTAERLQTEDLLMGRTAGRTDNAAYEDPRQQSPFDNDLGVRRRHAPAAEPARASAGMKTAAGAALSGEKAPGTVRLVNNGVTASGILPSAGENESRAASSAAKSAAAGTKKDGGSELSRLLAGEDSIFGSGERSSSGSVNFMKNSSAQDGDGASVSDKPLSAAGFRAAGVSGGSFRGKAASEGISAGPASLPKPAAPPKIEYRLPSTELLRRGSVGRGMKEEELQNTARILERTLRDFGVEVTVTDISCGPSVTRFEMRPEQGVKVSRIVSLADDIKLSLAATDVRIEAPIPGKSAVGIEVPNTENQTVYMRGLLESEEYRRFNSRICFTVGQDIGGKIVVADLAKMPHLLIAGATGSGKSVCINTIILSILYKAKPDEVQMIMIDPKVVELSVYNGIPHLRIPVVTDAKLAAEALNGAVKEMSLRYKKFAELNVRDIKGYNQKLKENPEEYPDHTPMPQIVIIVDEFADLMMVSASDVEQAICRLAQLARAAGIHLVLATQRPSVNVITGLIKANVQSRIAFAVSSGVDSRTIIDMNGAEKLLGKGDMLFYPTGYPKPVRVQGAFVSDEEVAAVADFWKAQRASGVSELEQRLSWMGTEGGEHDPDNDDSRDELFVRAAEYIIDNDKASIGNLQRVFRIGFNRAARLMDQMADAGIVGKEDGTKARQILMDRSQLEDWKRENGLA